MSETQQILHHILEHGNIAGRDAAERTIIQPTVDRRTLERLKAFGAEQPKRRTATMIRRMKCRQCARVLVRSRR
jgi:hypothetical protein